MTAHEMKRYRDHLRMAKAHYSSEWAKLAPHLDAKHVILAAIFSAYSDVCDLLAALDKQIETPRIALDPRTGNPVSCDED